MTIDLARVTISAPHRRIDLALPEHQPVAELLPDILRYAGVGLADDGERHGGWLLRRAGGEPVDAAQPLSPQGIRDGEVLHLVPARTGWPEIEYDDVVEVVAAGVRRIGRAWTPADTRIAAIVIGGLALAIGLNSSELAGPRWTAAAAVLLLLAGVIATRAYGDGPSGAALAAYALPLAFLSGVQVDLLRGSAALVLAAVAGAVGVTSGRRVFIAGITAGLLGLTGALLALHLPAKGAAAIVLAVLASGVGAVPLLAIRLGNLPIPPAALPDPSRIIVAVRRTTDILTGVLIGHAVVTAAASVLLVQRGGTTGRVLVAIVGATLLLRARLFATVAQRVPVLVAGLSALVAAAASVPAAPVVAGGAVLALVIVIGSTRPPSLYLGRAADLLDLALVVSVVPVACAVLDVYARVASA